MNALEGIWRLVDSRAWQEETDRLSLPYGTHPIGQIVFSGERMLIALWGGGLEGVPERSLGLSSYAGRYRFDGSVLECEVTAATDSRRVGGRQIRTVVTLGEHEMLWRPPSRRYGNQLERRETVWARVWRPGAGELR